MTVDEKLRRSEFYSMIRTVASTVTILVGIFWGGMNLKDKIVDGIRSELRAEIAPVKEEVKGLEKRVADVESENKIIRIELANKRDK